MAEVNNSSVQENKPQKRKRGNPTGKGGFQDHPELRNNGGRIKNPLKEFQREQFMKMSDKEKLEFLNQVMPYQRWTMAEGNPDSHVDANVKDSTFSDDEIAAAKQFIHERTKH